MLYFESMKNLFKINKSTVGVGRDEHWWSKHHFERILNPLLYEPLLVLVSNEASCSSESKPMDEDDVDLLFAAYKDSTSDDTALLQQILRHVSPGDQSLDYEGLTLLHIASKKGFQASVDVLLKHGDKCWTEVQNLTCTRHGNTPLHLAAKYGFDRCVHTLLNAKADPKVTNFAKKTALHYSCSCGYKACVEALLDHTSGKWKKHTMKSPSGSGDGGQVELVDMQDDSGLSALHLAVIDGCPAVVNLLLQAHCSVTLQDDQGRTALAVARTLDSAEHEEIVHLLEEESARSSGGVRPAVGAALLKGVAMTVPFSPPPPAILFDGLVIHSSPLS